MGKEITEGLRKKMKHYTGLWKISLMDWPTDVKIIQLGYETHFL